MSSDNHFADNRVVITFAIPHRNNFPGLLITLDSISRQIANSEKFEIVISDNQSDDGCVEELQKLNSKDSRIKVFLNDSDHGYDANLDLCIKRSNGQFVWLLGSGDMLGKHAVLKAYELIQSGVSISNISTKVTVSGDLDKKLKKHVTIERGYASSIEGLYNSALSGNIVNRALWIRAQKNHLRLENWCHAERILQMRCDLQNLANSIRSEEIEVFVMREENGWWNENSHLFLYNFLVHRELINIYSREPNLEQYTNTPSPALAFGPLFRAILKTTIFKKPASQILVTKVENLLKKQPVIFLIYFLVTKLSPRFKSFCGRVLRLWQKGPIFDRSKM